MYLSPNLRYILYYFTLHDIPYILFHYTYFTALVALYIKILHTKQKHFIKYNTMLHIKLYAVKN